MVLSRINNFIGDMPVEGGADATETAIAAKVAEAESSALSPAA